MVSSLTPESKVTAIAIASFSFLGISYVFYRKTRPSAAVPPGPPPLPIIGNAFRMPKELPWLKYAEWAKQYGETCLAASQRLSKFATRRYYARSGIQSTHSHSE